MALSCVESSKYIVLSIFFHRDECLPLCNAASPPANEALEAILVRCQQFKTQTSKCFHWSMYSGDTQMHFADEQNQQKN